MQRETRSSNVADAESRRLLTLLILGSLIVAVAILWVVSSALGAPLFFGLFVALFFLCLDSLAIVIVWYGMRRR